MRYFHRTTLGVQVIILAIALLCSTLAAAAQDPAATTDDSTDVKPADLAGNGLAVETALEAMGFGDLWRETTQLSEATRHLMVEYTGPNSEAAVATMLTALADLEKAESLRVSISAQIRKGVALLGLTSENVTRLQRVLSTAQEQLQTTIDLIQSVAIDIFSKNGSKPDEAMALAHPDLLLTRRSDELTAMALEKLIERRDRLESELGSAQSDLPAAIESRADAEATYSEITAIAQSLPEAISGLSDRIVEMLPRAAEMFIAAEVSNEPGLSLRALDAYFNAEAWIQEAQPSCGITWQTIGAVGLVESRHGTHGGNRLLPDGRTQFPIVGATLDGTGTDNFSGPVTVVADTDGGVYDGDPLHDRAIGPMQFIPETWRQWSVDADGDGRRDPNDIDDAAVATARYLCANGPIRSTAAWNAAIYVYNPSSSYVDSVRMAYHELDDAVTAATVEPLGEVIVNQ